MDLVEGYSSPSSDGSDTAGSLEDFVVKGSNGVGRGPGRRNPNTPFPLLGLGFSILEKISLMPARVQKRIKTGSLGCLCLISSLIDGTQAAAINSQPPRLRTAPEEISPWIFPAVAIPVTVIHVLWLGSRKPRRIPLATTSLISAAAAAILYDDERVPTLITYCTLIIASGFNLWYSIEESHRLISFGYSSATFFLVISSGGLAAAFLINGYMGGGGFSDNPIFVTIMFGMTLSALFSGPILEKLSFAKDRVRLALNHNEEPWHARRWEEQERVQNNCLPICEYYNSTVVHPTGEEMAGFE